MAILLHSVRPPLKPPSLRLDSIRAAGLLSQYHIHKLDKSMQTSLGWTRALEVEAWLQAKFDAETHQSRSDTLHILFVFITAIKSWHARVCLVVLPSQEPCVPICACVTAGRMGSKCRAGGCVISHVAVLPPQPSTLMYMEKTWKRGEAVIRSFTVPQIRSAISLSDSPSNTHTSVYRISSLPAITTTTTRSPPTHPFPSPFGLISPSPL